MDEFDANTMNSQSSSSSYEKGENGYLETEVALPVSAVNEAIGTREIILSRTEASPASTNTLVETSKPVLSNISESAVKPETPEAELEAIPSDTLQSNG